MGRKRENPEKNHLAHPQAELGLPHICGQCRLRTSQNLATELDLAIVAKRSLLKHGTERNDIVYKLLKNGIKRNVKLLNNGTVTNVKLLKSGILIKEKY